MSIVDEALEFTDDWAGLTSGDDHPMRVAATLAVEVRRLREVHAPKNAEAERIVCWNLANELHGRHARGLPIDEVTEIRAAARAEGDAAATARWAEERAQALAVLESLRGAAAVIIRVRKLCNEARALSLAVPELGLPAWVLEIEHALGGRPT